MVILKMDINMAKGFNSLIMAIDMMGCTPMGSQKVKVPMPGVMAPFTKDSSKMGWGLAMEYGNMVPKNMREHM